ncbi:MAG: hypothetical protein HY784_12130 [Chloroflexi bacterium]|nr:hypothetical protein [Chloroflexota bacterium]
MKSLPSLLNFVVGSLQACSFCRTVAVAETKEYSDERFFIKVRASLAADLSFQVRLYFNRGHYDYSYQLFAAAPLRRWDNKEDCPGLGNFPHHQHLPDGEIVGSALCGDPAADLPEVLRVVGELVGT